MGQPAGLNPCATGGWIPERSDGNQPPQPIPKRAVALLFEPLDYIRVSRYNICMKVKDSKKVFDALADETRLRILNLLSEGELCVCDLMSVLNEPQSKISRHLAYLRRSGLVETRKEGLWMHYRLSKPVSKIYGLLIKAVFGCRSDIDEFGEDMRSFNKKRSALASCCK